jgi:hypothetical protein
VRAMLTACVRAMLTAGSDVYTGGNHSHTTQRTK